MGSQKSQKTKQRVVDAALILFKEHGYDAVTIDHICEAGGIVKNTFYYHFKSKEALFSVCMSSQKGLSLNVLSEILLSDGSFFEKFLRMQEPRFAFIMSCGQEVMQYLCRIPSDKLLELFHDEADVHKVEIGLIEKAQAAGEILNSAAPDVLLGAARTQLLGILILASVQDIYRFPDMVRAAFEVVFDVVPELRKGDTNSIRIHLSEEKEEQ